MAPITNIAQNISNVPHILVFYTTPNMLDSGESYTRIAHQTTRYQQTRDEYWLNVHRLRRGPSSMSRAGISRRPLIFSIAHQTTQKNSKKHTNNTLS